MDAASQMIPSVEAETRKIMREDHFQTRLPERKVRRVNDTCYDVDTFFVDSVGSWLPMLEPLLFQTDWFGCCLLDATSSSGSDNIASDGNRMGCPDHTEVGQCSRIQEQDVDIVYRQDVHQT